MNWLFIIVCALMALGAFIGYKRGLVKMLIPLISLVVTLLFTSLFTPYISGFLVNHTPIYEGIKKECLTVIGVKSEDFGNRSEQNDKIAGLSLPESLRRELEENNNSAIYDALGVNNFVDYLGGYIAKTIVNILAYIITFVLIYILVRILLRTLNFITELPIIKSVNKLAGLLFGLIQGVLLLWIFQLILTVLSNTDYGRLLMEMTEKSAFLRFMYENNIFLHLIRKFTLGI